jgi:cell division transport system permease protein
VVMVIVLLLVSSSFVLRGMSTFLTATLEDSVDVSAYFVETATEEEVFRVRDELMRMGEVENVEYVSREEALEIFRATHQNDDTLLGPLEAIGRNPFLPALNIKAYDPNEYSEIAAFLDEESFDSVIAGVDFHDRAPLIERMSLITAGIRGGVLAVIVALSLVAILVAFNTIRLTIYSSKDEIEVMRLVGASNWFIRGPFLVQGFIVGMVSAVCTFVLVFALSYLISPKLETFADFDLAFFLGTNMVPLFLLLITVGIGLGVISSTIAIRRYLQV